MQHELEYYHQIVEKMISKSDFDMNIEANERGNFEAYFIEEYNPDDIRDEVMIVINGHIDYRYYSEYWGDCGNSIAGGYDVECSEVLDVEIFSIDIFADGEELPGVDKYIEEIKRRAENETR